MAQLRRRPPLRGTKPISGSSAAARQHLHPSSLPADRVRSMRKEALMPLQGVERSAL